MSASNSTPPTPDEMGESVDTGVPTSPECEDGVPELPSSKDSVPADSSAADKPKRMPSLRSVSDIPNMNPSSTTKGLLGRARNPANTPPPLATGAGGAMNNDVMARARALHQARMGMSPSPIPNSSSPSFQRNNLNGFPLSMPHNAMHRPNPVAHSNSDPIVPKPSLSQRKFGLKLTDMAGGPPTPPPAGLRRAGAPKLSDISSGGLPPGQKQNGPGGLGSKLDDFKKYIDAEKGWITFDGAATITKTGVNFASGQTFTISLDEVQILDELGKGNYGTVYKVRHSKPTAPRFGHGLSGVRLQHSLSDTVVVTKDTKVAAHDGPADGADGIDSTSGKLMAMKEIRLELDDAKFSTILKELVILHECVSPYIIDFYGAFFQDGAVYMCIEYMDGGSIDKLYTGGVPESVLRKITYSTVMGLKSLKDEHNIIHRDVKPTNILVNTRGQVKICDFGVSGNLVASIAKTNIGCQSYMAPERISGGGMAPTGSSDGTYSVQSDIWSLGLTIIECAMGRYPYPPEVSSTIFSQLNAIVEGDPPDLPKEGYSETAQSFVSGCLHKIPKMRATYAMLLKHPWLQPLSKPQTITEVAEEGEEAEKVAEAVGHLQLGETNTEDAEVAAWVKGIIQRSKDKGSGESSRPALHAAPLDSVSPLGSPVLNREP